MEQQVVHARKVEPVRRPLHERERRLEVLAQPRERLGRGELAAGHVGGGGRELEARDHRLVHLPEHLGLRDVGGGIEVDEVAGRAVRLVARQAAALVRPRRPVPHVVEVQLAERCAVVAPHARDRVGIAVPGERGDLDTRVVAAPGLELLEDARGEGGAVVLVRVVEVRARRARAEAREGLVEAAQVATQARDREGVDDVALAPRRRALHLLDRPLGHGGVDAKAPRRAPVEAAFGPHAARQLDALAGVRDRDDVARGAERQRPH